jgi:hypothetical protein
MLKKIKNFFVYSTYGPIIIVFLLSATLAIGYVKTMNRMYKEKPHTVTVAGKQYVRWTEFNGRFWQVFMVPVDSSKIIK